MGALLLEYNFSKYIFERIPHNGFRLWQRRLISLRRHTLVTIKVRRWLLYTWRFELNVLAGVLGASC